MARTMQTAKKRKRSSEPAAAAAAADEEAPEPEHPAAHKDDGEAGDVVAAMADVHARQRDRWLADRARRRAAGEVISSDEEEEEEEEEEGEEVEGEEDEGEEGAAGPSVHAWDGEQAYNTLADIVRGGLNAGESAAPRDYATDQDTDDEDGDFEMNTSGGEEVYSADEEEDDDASVVSEEGFTQAEVKAAEGAATAALVSVGLREQADKEEGESAEPAPVSKLAHMDEIAKGALEALDSDADEQDGDVDKGKLHNAERRTRALKAQVAKLCQTNSSLREANATLCHALRQNSIAIPQGAEMTSQELGAQLAGAQAQQGPALVGIAPPPGDDATVADDAPNTNKYRMQQLYLPDTSEMREATKFKLNGRTWPHGVASYMRTQDELAPVVEKRSKQVLEFQLKDRRDSSKVVTENDLKPDAAANPINFKLDLLYDDTGKAATLETIAESKRGTISQLTQPPVLNGNSVVPMDKGRVRFVIERMNIMSSITDPIHRKFRWLISPVDAGYDYLSCHSPAFYVMSKLNKVVNRGVNAGAPSAAEAAEDSDS